jgi:hypothetical protein
MAPIAPRRALFFRDTGALMDMMIVTHRPGPPLSHYLEALWYYDEPHSYKTVDAGRVYA